MVHGNKANKNFLSTIRQNRNLSEIQRPNGKKMQNLDLTYDTQKITNNKAFDLSFDHIKVGLNSSFGVHEKPSIFKLNQTTIIEPKVLNEVKLINQR